MTPPPRSPAGARLCDPAPWTDNPGAPGPTLPSGPPAPRRSVMSVERLRWLVLVLLFFSTAINYLDRQALSVLLPTLREELSLTSSAYGTIATLFLLAYMAVLPCGMWIDRVGTRLGFSVAIVGWSLAAIAHAFVTGPIGLGFARVWLGLTEAGNWPAGAKAVATWFPQKRRALAMGVFDSGSALGAVLAPPVVAYIALHHGWKTAFVSTGLLGFIWLAGWLWIYHAPQEHPWLSARDRAEAARELGATPPKRLPFGAALRQIIGQRALWGLLVARLIASPVWWFYVFWLPDYLSKGRGFSLQEIGLYGWIPYLTVDLGRVAGGLASDALLARGRSVTFARKSIMVLGAIAMLGSIAVVNTSSAAAAIAWVSVATFGFGLWTANIFALHADIFPAETMATAMGATLMAASLSSAVFTFLIGQLVDHSGYLAIFWSAALLPVLACIALFALLGSVKRIHLSGAST